jgi:hypothetical protein
MNRQDLIDKLLRIEALHAGATTSGEREAAANARQRILERLRQTAEADPPVEMRFRLHDPWSRMLFLALARRYELRPYRLPRQHQQTIMLRVPAGFVNQTLWPEFVELNRELVRYLSEVTRRVISEAIHEDSSEAPEVRELGSTTP